MITGFLAALVAVTVAYVVLLDRMTRRHDAQIGRLLVHVQAPETAVAHAISSPGDGPLYLPAEDDKAWNSRHGAAE